MDLVPIVIICLTLFGFIIQIWAITHYRSELNNLENLKLFFITNRNKDSQTPSAILEESNVGKKTMAGERLTEVAAFAKYPGMVALHDLGAAAAEADDGKLRNSIPAVLISSLLIVGLFGTLWSLKNTLSDPSLAQFVSRDGLTNASMFQEALGPVIKGFGAAFHASIAGVGGTLFLIFSRIFVRDAREACFVGIEKLTIEDILPYYVEPEQSRIANAAEGLIGSQESIERAGKFFAKHERSMMELTKNFGKSLTEVKNVFGEDGVIAQRMRQFSEGNRKEKEKVTDLLEAAVSSSKTTKAIILEQRDLVKELQGAAKNSLTSATENTKSQADSLDKMRVTFDGFESAINTKLESMTTAYKKLGEVPNHLKDLEKTCIKLEASLQQFVDTGKLNQQKAWEANEFMGAIQEMQKYMKTLQGEITDAGQRQQSNIQQVTETLNQNRQQSLALAEQFYSGLQQWHQLTEKMTHTQSDQKTKRRRFFKLTDQ